MPKLSSRSTRQFFGFDPAQERPFSVAFCRRLLSWAWRHEPDVLPDVLLPLFAGLHPRDKRGASWEDINWQEGTIWVADRNVAVPLHCAWHWFLFMGKSSSRGLVSPFTIRQLQSYNRFLEFLASHRQMHNLGFTYYLYCDPKKLPSHSWDKSRAQLFHRKGALLQRLTPQVVLKPVIGVKQPLELEQPTVLVSTDLNLA